MNKIPQRQTPFTFVKPQDCPPRRRLDAVLLSYLRPCKVCYLYSDVTKDWPWHVTLRTKQESRWNVTAHGDAREGKWRGNWRMEWVASTLHTTSEHGVSSITNADAHNSAASSRLNRRHRRFKWTRPFRRKTKSGFCACAITFQTQSTLHSGKINSRRSSVPKVVPNDFRRVRIVAKSAS